MIKIEENSHCNVEITGQTSFLFLGSSDDDSFNRQNKVS